MATSTQSFERTDAIDMTKEKDWSHQLGLMDWDSTRIVFTKRSLVEFLKYTGVTIDTNYTNISKLPRYAQFGKLVVEDPLAPPASEDKNFYAGTCNEEPARPSRRVRTAPGGSTSNIFGEAEFGDDALSSAPRQNRLPDIGLELVTGPDEFVTEEESTMGNNFKPSRRVRTGPGGKDSLADLWSEEPPVAEFKPTRKVRQAPGGQDNLAGIL
ncbi:hypothetical protein BD410DRAFT_782269 [Rickenella mellea]|uniref:Uncharacterized protein n=1 Tax=Rickenella mellea TaxID=50990 RepID=A0A4Y7QHR0_9AGAM|nr:hypothetical protein BD410DRAFT_782269 [Rickenella mellea]